MALERHLIQVLPFTSGETEAWGENVDWLRSHSEWQSQADP